MKAHRLYNSVFHYLVFVVPALCFLCWILCQQAWLPPQPVHVGSLAYRVKSDSMIPGFYGFLDEFDISDLPYMAA